MTEQHSKPQYPKPDKSPDKSSAAQAKFDALKISFAPITFQATHALLKLNILELIDKHGNQGISAQNIAEELSLNLYGVKVLLDVALSCHLVWRNDENYVLDKTGYFVLHDSMVRTNLDFVQDVCYQGLFHLVDAIKNSRPEGLKVFGDWQTIYPAISSLPEPAKTSWFNFDHYYSDKAFAAVLPVIFSQPVHWLLDIGGNTGRWATRCLKFNQEVRVTIVDLPQQVASLKPMERCNSIALNVLAPDAQLPRGADVIWMSQFLDCFSEEEILQILQMAAAAMDSETRLYILDLFYDRQKYEAAAYSINCISIYFTCMANGNSRMYHSKDIINLIHKAGLCITADIDGIGAGHTLLYCKLKLKVPAALATEDYLLAKRAEKGSRKKYLAVLKKVPNAAAEERDRY